MTIVREKFSHQRFRKKIFKQVPFTKTQPKTFAKNRKSIKFPYILPEMTLTYTCATFHIVSRTHRKYKSLQQIICKFAALYIYVSSLYDGLTICRRCRHFPRLSRCLIQWKSRIVCTITDQGSANRSHASR